MPGRLVPPSRLYKPTGGAHPHSSELIHLPTALPNLIGSPQEPAFRGLIGPSLLNLESLVFLRSFAPEIEV